MGISAAPYGRPNGTRAGHSVGCRLGAMERGQAEPRTRSGYAILTLTFAFGVKRDPIYYGL